MDQDLAVTLRRTEWNPAVVLLDGDHFVLSVRQRVMSNAPSPAAHIHGALPWLHPDLASGYSHGTE
jgi:hypothetical protein